MIEDNSENKSLKRGIKYWIRLLSVGLIGGILIALLAIEVIYINVTTNPAPSVVGDPPPNNNGIEYQPVTLISDLDGIPLSGWYIPSENGAAIILLHGFGGNRLEMLSRAKILAQHGYGVLLYDLRGHGESGGDVRTFGWQDVDDVNTALDFLLSSEEVDPDQIGILGFSIGGQIAIRAAAEHEEIRAIIADDPAFVTVDDAPRPRNITEKIVYAVSWLDGRCVSLWTGIPIPVGVPETLTKVSPRPIMFIDTGETGGRELVRSFYHIADQP